MKKVPTKKIVKPKKKAVKKVVKKSVDNQVMGIVLEMLKLSNPEAYAKVTQQEEEQVAQEPSQTFEEYCEDMQQAVRHYVDCSKVHTALEIDMMHAILFKKVTHIVHKINSSNPMMPYEKDEEGTFCIVQIFYWDDSVKAFPLLQQLVNLGAECHDVKVAEQVREWM